MTAGRPRAFETVEDLQQGIDAYYAECEAIDEPLTVSGLADSLGVSRETVHTYSSGEYDNDEHKYSDTIKKAVTKIERDKIAKAMLGKYDRTICIFDLKNNHGWKDQQHIENTGNTTQRIVVTVADDDAMDADLEDEY